MIFGDLSCATYSFSEAAPRATWHVQIRHRRGLQLPSYLGNAHSAIHSAIEQTAMPFLQAQSEQDRVGRGGEVAACGMVWRQ